MAPNGSCFYVNVHSQEQGSMKFTAKKDDMVKKINEQISSKIKVPVKNQMLLLGSETLNPENKLSDYWSDTTTTIHLTLKVVKTSDEQKVVKTSDEEQKVFLVEVGEGRKHSFNIPPSYSVSQVRKMIEDLIGGPLTGYNVTCNGKNLEDGKIMSDYFIAKGNNNIININVININVININIINNIFLFKRCIGG